MIYLLATLQVKPDSMEAIMKAVAPCIDATRLEAGNISYDLFQSTTEENTLVFVERWKDQAAIDNHFKQPHLLAWIDAGAEYILDRKIEIITPEKIA